MEYSVGQGFAVGVHIAQYFGDFWGCAADASIHWASTADAAVGSVGISDVVAGWVSVGACSMASVSLALTMASQFCCIYSGWYPTLIFLGLNSLSLWGDLVIRWFLFMVWLWVFWQKVRA